MAFCVAMLVVGSVRVGAFSPALLLRRGSKIEAVRGRAERLGLFAPLQLRERGRVCMLAANDDGEEEGQAEAKAGADEEWEARSTVEPGSTPDISNLSAM